MLHLAEVQRRGVRDVSVTVMAPDIVPNAVPMPAPPAPLMLTMGGVVHGTLMNGR